jgi:hypothetical protein
MATTRTRKPTTISPSPPRDVEQAVATLFDNYNKDPFITSFFRAHGVTPRGAVAELRQRVVESLTTPDGPLPLTFETFDEVLGDLQRTGAQHVAFFRLPDKNRDRLLTKLREEATLRKCLAQAGWGEHVNRRQYVEMPTNLDDLAAHATVAPTLAGVTFDPGESLVFEWVQPQAWYEFVRVEEEGGERTKVWERRWEKSVNFVHFDLRTGDSEVMIQRLRPNPEKPVTEEIAEYHHLMVSLLTINPFTLVPMEPAIRHLLTTRIREVKRWMILLGKGARMDCSAGRSSFKSVEIPLPFEGRLLHFNWRLKKNSRRRIPLQLDARSDTLTITHPCLKQEHAGILADIRGAATTSPAVPGLPGVRGTDLKVTF